ncbi:sugar lactone lactonase YvrE [Scopulibacillus darangshiensis]|uniref:Regucalcin n=1 Tax=Scopulibacillus darangshiensis TaxID=442528 RepID=A0A4R2P7T3_9BACL|nr:SMP-30/gluconolactonase/LRE family protein [Scopulibacillus darangshiensis]TCP30963.1 sugar lactone lactonase YvrE [Scopulibacillus darangshiensis]
MKANAELFLETKCVLGEGPCWDERRNVLLWVDILKNKLYMYDFFTKKVAFTVLPECVTSVVCHPFGDYVITMGRGFYFFNSDTGVLRPIQHLESHLPNNRFNDGKCDPLGRYWAGTMDQNGAKFAGSLYVLDKDLQTHKMLENVSISNGLAWSPDGAIMYYIDTLTNEIVSFKSNFETGLISDKRTVIHIDKEDGCPDGMTIDQEGMLWISHWGGGKVTRWNPDTGDLLQTVNVPAPYVTSCTFGGKRLDELYITTACVDLTEEEVHTYPLSGSVFRIKTTVKGLPSHKFIAARKRMKK